MFNLSGNNGFLGQTPDSSKFGFSNSSMILSSMKNTSNNRPAMATRSQNVFENFISTQQEEEDNLPDSGNYNSQAYGLRNIGFSKSTGSRAFNYSAGQPVSQLGQMQQGLETKKKKGISFKDTGQNVLQAPSKFETLLSQTRLQNDYQMPSSYSSTRRASKGILKNKNSKHIAENINYEKLKEIEAEDYNNLGAAVRNGETVKEPRGFSATNVFPEADSNNPPLATKILRADSFGKTTENKEVAESKEAGQGPYQPKKLKIGLADDDDEEENKLKNIFTYSLGKVPATSYTFEGANNRNMDVNSGGGSGKQATFDIFDLKGPSPNSILNSKKSADSNTNEGSTLNSVSNQNDGNSQGKAGDLANNASTKDDTYYPNEFPPGVLTKPGHNIIAKGNYIQGQAIKTMGKIGEVWRDADEDPSDNYNNNNKKHIKSMSNTNIGKPSSIFSFNSSNLLSEFKTISKDASFFAEKPEDGADPRALNDRKKAQSSYVVPKQPQTGITYPWQKPSERLKNVIIDKNEVIKKALIPGYYEGTFSYFKQLINEKNEAQRKNDEVSEKGNRVLPDDIDEEEEEYPKGGVARIGEKKQETQKKPSMGPLITSFITNDATYNMNFYVLLNKSVIHHNIEKLNWSVHDQETNLKGECLSFCDLRDNRMIICGGIDPTYGEVLNSCFIFDGATKKLSKASNMITPRYFHLLLLNNGVLFAIGGISKGETVMRVCEKFNLVKQEWSQIEPLKLRRKTLKGVSSHAEEALYVFGKSSTLKKDSNIFFVEKYDIASNNWSVLTLRHSLRFNEDSRVILALRNTEASRRPVSHLIIFTKEMINEEEQIDSVFINLTDYQVSTNAEFRINPEKYFITHKDDIYVFPKNAFDECDRLSLASYKTEHLLFKRV